MSHRVHSLSRRSERAAGGHREGSGSIARPLRRSFRPPLQMDGVPCIRGLRILVAAVVRMVAEGMTEDDILEAYSNLEREDVREAMRYAAAADTDAG